jgi:hypothetical protein
MVRGNLARSLVVCCAFGGIALGSHPARALDDGKGNSLMDVLDLVGLGEKKEEAVIQYRERPPLVLPPKTELRQPLPPAAQRAANWPQDQESIRAAKKARDNRFRAAEEENRDPNFAGKLTRMGRINPNDAVEKSGPNQECSMVPDSPNKCDPTTFWNKLSVKNDSPSTRGLQAGVEPDRQYLTQPPKGYRAPKQNVAASFEPQKDPNGGSIFDYFRPEKRAE